MPVHTSETATIWQHLDAVTCSGLGHSTYNQSEQKHRKLNKPGPEGSQSLKTPRKVSPDEREGGSRGRQQAATCACVHDPVAIRQIPGHFSFVYISPSKYKLAAAPALAVNHAAFVRASISAADVTAQTMHPTFPPAATQAAA